MPICRGLKHVQKQSRRRDYYRIDFVLTVLTGNLSRYLALRPIIEGDPTIQPRWYPIRTWFKDDWLRFLPGGVRIRARHLLDSYKLFVRRPPDAVVMHALDTYSLYGAWHRLFRLRTVLINNPDATDFAGKGKVSHWMLQSAVDRTSLFVPWSEAAAREMLQVFPEIANRLTVIHPGLVLEKWPMRSPVIRPGPYRILFVGGDAMRKGLDTLLDAFEQVLNVDCALDVASQRAFLPDEVISRMEGLENTRLHLDLTPGSVELKALFDQADVFVLPTRSDASPWVAIEALATGVPVVISAKGGIDEIVLNEETGLIIPSDDPEAIVVAVQRLQSSPDLVERLVRQGRRHVEVNYSASNGTARLLDAVKRLVDDRR